MEEEEALVPLMRKRKTKVEESAVNLGQTIRASKNNSLSQANIIHKLIQKFGIYNSKDRHRFYCIIGSEVSCSQNEFEYNKIFADCLIADMFSAAALVCQSSNLVSLSSIKSVIFISDMI